MTNNENEIYERQRELDVNPPNKATVIGVGGVGSWVALDLALAGVDKLYLADHDGIEKHNLNRTPFKQSQIGMDKTQAVVELISERRMDAEVIPITKRIEDTTGAFRDEMSDSVVVDCRDHASELPNDISENVLLTAGYDGMEFTLHVKPDYESIWGDEETEYETVPSFVAPPQFLASLVTVIASTPSMAERLEEQIKSGNIRDLILGLVEQEHLYSDEDDSEEVEDDE